MSITSQQPSSSSIDDKRLSGSFYENNSLSSRPNDSDLKILIFTATYFVLDGVTLTIRRLESHLRSRGAQVKIVSTVPDDKLNDPQAIKDVIIVPGIKIPFNHAGDYSFGVGLDENTIREIEKFGPNVVHFTVPDFVGLDGVRWCQRNNIAYFATWHSNYTEYLKYYFLEWILAPGLNRYLKGFFEQMPVVYVPTAYMLRKMREDWGYGTTTELKEWGRGVDMALFSPERRSRSFRMSKGISDDDIVVLWVSRIVPEKRPDIWFKVVKKLQDEGLPIKPIVVGSGTYEKQFAKLKDVVCCGWMSGTLLAEVYASSDILLFPSDVETFGNVTLEALASGCPCVVEKKCGEHLVEHGVNGLTCTAGDVEAFYQATRRIIVDNQLRSQMSVNAREKAWKFDRNLILQQMAENYKDAIVNFRDPNFLKRHLQSPEGAGKNLLSIICCDYFIIKKVAEPFLNSSRKIQDVAEGAVECVNNNRNRLGCTEFLSSASLNALDNQDDEETGLLNHKKTDDKNIKARKQPSLLSSCFYGNSFTRLLKWAVSILLIGLIMIYFYATSMQ